MNPLFFSMKSGIVRMLTFCTVLLSAFTWMLKSATYPICISENGRYLVYEDGTPFFYLGDTAWEIFHRLNREEVDTYLGDRAEKGFTVIQTVLLAESNGLISPNSYGYLPFVDGDPRKPDVQDGESNDYWDHVDYIIEKAESLGLVIAIAPTWGDKWNLKWGIGPEVFNPENAAVYGSWLGERYRDRNVIWILGGDRPIESETHAEIIHSMANALRSKNQGRQLMTYHPSGGGHSSSEWFHNADWLDFNMMQTGPNFERKDARYFPDYERIESDYGLLPVKPCMDAEPGYENAVPVHGTFNAACIRRWAYWSLFAGGHGFTYGALEVWQFAIPGIRGKNGIQNHWRKALDYEGARQMGFIKSLLLSRPYIERIPDQSLIVGDTGEGIHHIRVTRGKSYAMIYLPTGKNVIINMGIISGEKVRAWWYLPKTGESEEIGVFENKGQLEFAPDELILEGHDRVLILDDISKGFGEPGSINLYE